MFQNIFARGVHVCGGSVYLSSLWAYVGRGPKRQYFWGWTCHLSCGWEYMLREYCSNQAVSMREGQLGASRGG